MASLSGPVSATGLVPLTNFLCRLRRSGDLLVWCDEWAGLLSFEDGHVVGAELDQATGLAALSLLARAVDGAAFKFADSPPTLRDELAENQTEVRRHLRRLEAVGGQPVRQAASPPITTDPLPTPASPTRSAWPTWVGATARELGKTALVTLLCVVLLRTAIQNFRVEGTSMEPSFTSGQALAINRAAYLVAEPQRGDVVVFRAPPEPDKDFIKRVIGLPGDTVRVEHSQVYVNGEPLAEPYIEFPADYQLSTQVPERSYFVLGDNRPDSFDSHTGWFVPAVNLVGRAFLSYWPPQRWGPVGSP